MSSNQRVAILGSTGSIGTQTLEVIQAFPDKLTVQALAAGQNTAVFNQQCQAFSPVMGSLADEQLWCAIDTPPKERYSGTDGLCRLASHPDVDIVVVGLVGAIGLQPTLAALKAGKRVLTANKETFVAAGHLVTPYLHQICPIDSEHSAIFQCLAGVDANEIYKLWLTASGGPFRTWAKSDIAHATRAQALNHPNWTMGAKITIDSATMMNKGLEVIEAHWLFGVDVNDINVVVHPQSVVHSGVELVDGTVLTQWGTPDMRVPIQVGFSWPRRWPQAFAKPGQENHVRLACPPAEALTFEAADMDKFPALALAVAAAKQGPVATAVLNAANEVAVARFLEDEIAFGDIPACVESVLALDSPVATPLPDLASVLTLDNWARHQAQLWQPTASRVSV